MTKGQLKRLLIAMMVGMVIMIVLLSVSSEKKYIESEDFSYDLLNDDMPNNHKKYAEIIAKELIEFMKVFNSYSKDIDFSKIYSDSIECQVVKSEYTKMLENNANKPYLEELKKYYDVKLVNIYSIGGESEKTELISIKYGAIFKIEYLDLEKNYKIFKNRQFSNEIDSNMEFLEYLKVPENIVISTKFINDYKITWDLVNDKATYSPISKLISLQIPVANITETIEQELEKIVYDVSLESIPENEEKFKKAKTTADKVVQEITAKNYKALASDVLKTYDDSIAKTLKVYMDEFNTLYKESELVKYIEKESKIRFIGYNNTESSLIYEIEEYPYEETVKLFIKEKQSTKVLTKANNFALFSKLVENNEIKKTKRIVEIEVSDNGKLKESLLMELMPKVEYLWNKQELEFTGLVSIKPTELPGDYTSYFSVQEMSGIGKHISVVYVPRSSFESSSEYLKFTKEKIHKTLTIILGNDLDNATEYYKKQLNLLYDKIIGIIYDSMDDEVEETFTRKNSKLNGVELTVRKKKTGITVLIKCDNWEVTEE